MAELNAQVSELKLAVEGLERERDFYFGKLRDVEILLQTFTGGEKDLVDKMFKILYATEEDFVTVDVCAAPVRAANSPCDSAPPQHRRTATNCLQRKWQPRQQHKSLPKGALRVRGLRPLSPLMMVMRSDPCLACSQCNCFSRLGASFTERKIRHHESRHAARWPRYFPEQANTHSHMSCTGYIVVDHSINTASTMAVRFLPSLCSLWRFLLE